MSIVHSTNLLLKTPLLCIVQTDHFLKTPLLGAKPRRSGREKKKGIGGERKTR
ncbi:hypothetical protein Sjap_002792 [Stephania japonica]|uniref:Uncharacterized protein n=1 Tax=Stephania japonica TaxID=461633 RepID=A0AAP0KPN7_9MAGN